MVQEVILCNGFRGVESWGCVGGSGVAPTQRLRDVHLWVLGGVAMTWCATGT